MVSLPATAQTVAAIAGTSSVTASVGNVRDVADAAVVGSLDADLRQSSGATFHCDHATVNGAVVTGGGDDGVPRSDIYFPRCDADI